MTAPGKAPMCVADVKDIADAISDLGWAVIALSEHPELGKVGINAPMRVINAAAQALSVRLESIAHNAAESRT